MHVTKQSKFADPVTNLNLIRKWFSFIVITESWLTEESYFALEIIGYKAHTLKEWVGPGEA